MKQYNKGIERDIYLMLTEEQKWQKNKKKEESKNRNANFCESCWQSARVGLESLLRYLKFRLILLVTR